MATDWGYQPPAKVVVKKKVAPPASPPAAAAPPKPIPQLPAAGSTQGAAAQRSPAYTPAYSSAPATTNTAQTPPDLTAWKAALAARQDASTMRRSIDTSNLGAFDAAAMAQKQARANLAARGATGSGVASAVNRNITEAGQRQAAAGANQIVLAEQGRQDQLVRDQLTGANSIVGSGLADRSFALQQLQAEQAAAAQRAQLEMQQQQMAAAEKARQEAQWLALTQMAAAGQIPAGVQIPQSLGGGTPQPTPGGVGYYGYDLNGNPLAPPSRRG